MNSDNYPQKPGVYLMKDSQSRIIYIGKAKNLRDRIKQYFRPGQDSRAMVPFLISHVTEIDTIVTFNEKEALLLENELIKRHQPKYNVLLKDDKTFISLVINNKHKWPMLKLVRYRKGEREEGLYFGPYTSAVTARTIFTTLIKIFPLRQCSDNELTSRKRPCILHSIKRCVAPCVGKCTESEYQTLVKEVISFLKGKHQDVLQQLKKQMEEASEKLQFEKAAIILSSLRQLEALKEEPKIVVETKLQSCDVFHFQRRDQYILIIKLIVREGKLIGSDHFDFSGLFQSNEELFTSFLLQHYATTSKPDQIVLPLTLADKALLEEILELSISEGLTGERKSLLELAHENAKALYEQERKHLLSEEELLTSLQELLQLNRLPSRIECFDTSNISGSDPVASLAAFMNGVKDPNRSRLYKITTTKGVPDDYQALTEALTRRLSRGKEENDLPDLIIVDGGKGQLNVALKVFESLGIATIDVISFAKEEARHDKGLTQERIFIPHEKEPITLDPHSSLHFFLQNIRDSAHQKAIGFHRKKRASRIIKSALDDIPGIGPTKKRRLLQHFGSVKRIKEASLEELLESPSITKKDADTILRFFSRE